MGASPEGSPLRSVECEEECSIENELQRAERLGLAWLQRYRRIEGSNLLPSVEPLNELLLGLDFFADLREEDVRSLSAGAHSTDKDAESTTTNAGDTVSNASEGDADDGELDEEGDNALDSEPAENVQSSSRYGDHLRAIPTVIRNENQYVGFFLPLFLQEAKQALARSVKLDFGRPEEFVQVSANSVSREASGLLKT